MYCWSLFLVFLRVFGETSHFSFVFQKHVCESSLVAAAEGSTQWKRAPGDGKVRVLREEGKSQRDLEKSPRCRMEKGSIYHCFDTIN